MKRTLLIITALVLVLTMVLASGCDFGTPTVPSVDVGPGIVLSQQNTGIWVSGEGKVTVVPDIAVLTLGVQVQKPTVAEAQSEATKSMDAVMYQLKRLGVADKDIETQNYSIYPVTRWDSDNNVEVLLGYRVTNTVTAKVRKMEDTGDIIAAVVAAGGDNIQINSISFSVDNPEQYLAEARTLAVADAAARAEQLADLAGVRLGNATYISESGGSVPIIRQSYMEAMPVPAPAPPPISPGETDIQINVQIVYAIR
ncbi:MAG: SIMPL domain-containing protein [Chloroflexota bacterium]